MILWHKGIFQIRILFWIQCNKNFVQRFLRFFLTFSRFGISSRLRNLEFEGKINIKHTSIYIIRREIFCWFRIWSSNFIWTTHSREKRFLICVGGFKQFLLHWIQKKIWFVIYPYVKKSRFASSRIWFFIKIALDL